MDLKKKLARMAFKLIPEYNRSLYDFFSRYIDRFNGDNNSNPTQNGEYLFLRNILPRLRGGAIVYDVGANVGSWASFVLSVNPKVNLHCFEPSDATYAKLACKGWPSNVWLNNFGLGEADGVLELNIVDELSGLNSLYVRRGIDCVKTVKRERVNIATIDGYCEKNAIQQIDLIKVDVEGHELAVFRGMRRMMSQGRVRVIQFEYGGCNLDAKVCLADIWEFLESFGFKFYKLYPEGPRHIKRYQQGMETFKYSNWICSKNGINL